MSVIPEFRTPQWRPYRAGMFVAMGLSAVVPVAHGWGLYGRERMERQIGLSWLLLQGALYILGAGLYAVCKALLSTEELRIITDTVTVTFSGEEISR